MAKVLCVLYDDPVTGCPKSYARDGLPTASRSPWPPNAARSRGRDIRGRRELNQGRCLPAGYKGRPCGCPFTPRLLMLRSSLP